MSNQFILNAFRDMLPTEQEPFPKEMTDYANLLYLTSKSKAALPPQLEVSRYHLCCYLTIEKFSKQLELHDPVLNKIPIPHRKIRSIVVDFKRSLTGGNKNISSQESTPPSTPRKKRKPHVSSSQLMTPNSSSLKNPYATPQSSSKKSPFFSSSSLDTPPSSVVKLLKFGSGTNEFEPGTLVPSSPIEQRSTYQLPQKVRAARKSLRDKINSLDEGDSRKSPRKSRGRQVGEKLLPMAKRAQVDDTIITTPHLVSFCNRFYLPEDITKNILITFQDYYYRIKSPWGLLCGLVAIAYMKLNHEKIEHTLGFKSKFMKNLHILQSGRLKFEELISWTKLIENLCSSEKWIRDLDDLYQLKNENQLPFGIPSLNSFISADTCYFSNRMNDEYNEWLNKIKESTLIEE